MSFIFALLFSLNSWALDPVAIAIDQAHGLVLKKNRQEACAVLRRTLDSTAQAAKPARAKLAEALAQISEMFFTDKGQKAFEAGQSLMFENPDVAMNRLHEALALEDSNIVVLSTIAKLQIFKQECDGALSTLAQARKINPLAAEPAVLELRTLICQQDFDGLRSKAKTLTGLGKWEEQFVQYLLARDYLEQKAPKKAFDGLLRLTEEQPKFPETYFYLAQAGGELNKENQVWLEKYVSLCKAVTVRERKRYSLEPRLCANLKEAEDEVAKKTVDM